MIGKHYGYDSATIRQIIPDCFLRIYSYDTVLFFNHMKMTVIETVIRSHSFLKHSNRSKDSKCLDDQPTKREIITTKPFDMPGSLYDADQQCQLAYGEDARACHGEKFLGVSMTSLL